MGDAALHVALLAPVPLEHLLSGRSICDKEGRVAFGSRAWKVFRELDELRKGLTVDVYVYASHADCPPHLEVVTWGARYIGHVESHGGAHPEGMRFRPASTAEYGNDNEGYWAIFWEVESLHELLERERIRLSEFFGVKKGKPYKIDFIPEGPLLVQQPR